MALLAFLLYLVQSLLLVNRYVFLLVSMDEETTTWPGHGLDVLAHAIRDLHILLTD